MKTESVERIPEVDTLWAHRNGQVYQVRAITNVGTSRPEQYPVTVVYQNVNNRTMWSRRADDWHRSFRQVGLRQTRWASDEKTLWPVKPRTAKDEQKEAQLREDLRARFRLQREESENSRPVLSAEFGLSEDTIRKIERADDPVQGVLTDSLRDEITRRRLKGVSAGAQLKDYTLKRLCKKYEVSKSTMVRWVAEIREEMAHENRKK